MNFSNQPPKSRKQFLYNTDKLSDQLAFSDQIYDYLLETRSGFSDIVILCIGTDRATGDSLGPLIGHKLHHLNYDHIHVYGTLESPVHAKNLDGMISDIHEAYASPFIIAIDACLGKIEHIGYVGFGKGSIKPGAGVNKDLPEVGDLFVTGIVNFSGVMDMVILQNTRLHLVMKMADFITFAIKSALWKYERDLEPMVQDKIVD